VCVRLFVLLVMCMRERKTKRRRRSIHKCFYWVHPGPKTNALVSLHVGECVRERERECVCVCVCICF